MNSGPRTYFCLKNLFLFRRRKFSVLYVAALQIEMALAKNMIMRWLIGWLLEYRHSVAISAISVMIPTTNMPHKCYIYKLIQAQT